MQASRWAGWAVSVVAIAVVGCGGGGGAQGRDAMSTGDAPQGSDARPSDDATPDRPGDDGGSNDKTDSLCFGPADCAAGQICCLMFDGSGLGVVSCQPSCVSGVSTWVVCMTDADCPAEARVCSQIATTDLGVPFSVCNVTAAAPTR